MVVSGEAPAGITAVNRGHDWGKQAYRCSRHRVHSWRSPLRPHTLGVCELSSHGIGCATRPAWCGLRRRGWWGAQTRSNMLFMLNLLLLLMLLSNILTRVTGQTLNTLDDHSDYQACIASPSACTVLYVPSHPPRKRQRYHHISEATHAIDQGGHPTPCTNALQYFGVRPHAGSPPNCPPERM